MSAIRKYADALMGRANREDLQEVGKEALTSGLTGIAAGYLSGRRKGGLDVHIGPLGVPIDGTLGAMGLVGSVFAPPKYFPSHIRAKVREVSGTLFGIGLFRKTEEWTGKRPKESKTTITGKSVAGAEGHPEMQGNEDPIIAAAKALA